MRLCRYLHNGSAAVGFYREDFIVPLRTAAQSQGVSLPESDNLLDFLPGGSSRNAVVRLQQRLQGLSAEALKAEALSTDDVQLLVPVAHPSKLMLLAGNYMAHIREGGDRAEEREKTFPYVFMKPPSTTLTNPGDPVRLPALSPDHIDWELELGVIIGRRCRGVAEAQALDCVAGYTIVNDISDRQFRPNPHRTKRDKDGFFDWLHGKWHDTFCPMGPCVLPADECPDPQALRLSLRVNNKVEQDASTAEMIFPVAAIVEFIASFVTLNPGDVISTGTPSGVGAAKGRFLKPGDFLQAEIEGIGVLRNPVQAG